MRKVLLLTATALIAVVLLYLSRFWFLSLWPRSGLFGIDALRPQGGLLARWVRGTDAAPFELILWAILCFLVLTVAQNLFDRIPWRSKAGDD